MSCRVRKKKVGGAKLYRNGWLAQRLILAKRHKRRYSITAEERAWTYLRRVCFALRTTMCLFVCQLNIMRIQSRKEEGLISINGCDFNGSALISLR